MPPTLDRELQRELAKVAMTTALAVTVLTAPSLHRNRLLKNVHTGAGLVLVGCAIWHHLLYQPNRAKKNQKKRENPSPDQRSPLSLASPTAETPAPLPEP